MSTPSQPENQPTAPKPTGLWGRLRGAFQAIAAPPPPSPEEVVPTWDAPQSPPLAQLASEIPAATPVSADGPSAEPLPEVVPVAEVVGALEQPKPVEVAPATSESATPPSAAVDNANGATESAPASTAAEAPLPPCPACQSPRLNGAPFCHECGYLFPPPEEAVTAPDAAEPPHPPRRIADRYEIQGVIGTNGALTRFRALDFGAEGNPTPVVLVRMKAAAELAKVLPPASTEFAADDEAPTAPAEATGTVASTISSIDFSSSLAWPGLGWEWALLTRAHHAGVPQVLNHFPDGEDYFLVEEAFAGQSLWDAWDDPAATVRQRFTWLAEAAEALEELHHAGAILEGLRPEFIVVRADGHVAIADLSDLLPLPLPPCAPIKATPYSAPELILASETADARADLYSFGATMYALYLGRELTEIDFERQGVPKPFVLQFPDAHPLVGRILMKTFVREPNARFPSDEAFREDASGFKELIQTLRIAADTLGLVRLDAAGWTNTGLMRTNNEDAFAILHATSGRLHQLSDQALVILADGMGGAAAGEVASSMAVNGLQKLLLEEPMCTGLRDEPSKPQTPLDLVAAQIALNKALGEINREIHDTARAPGKGRRGMGCTAEVVFIDGRQLVFGHVGDSRIYHYTAGKLAQLTRDHTLVNRLVELGQLTAEEAEKHPRKNELQQAMGGLPQVEPQTAAVVLHPGDWVVVCSDGLTNHVDHATLTEMIQRADSAEMLARRLVNLANLKGGSDNCTVVAIRVT